MAEVTPLYVLLSVMQTRWKEEDFEAAVGLAKAAAPYVHGRAATVAGPGDMSEMPDEELEGGVEAERAEAAGGGPG